MKKLLVVIGVIILALAIEIGLCALVVYVASMIFEFAFNWWYVIGLSAAVMLLRSIFETGYHFPSPTKGTVFQMPKRDRAKEGDPPGVKGLRRPLRSQNSLLTKLPVIRGKTHGEQKG